MDAFSPWFITKPVYEGLTDKVSQGSASSENKTTVNPEKWDF